MGDESTYHTTQTSQYQLLSYSYTNFYRIIDPKMDKIRDLSSRKAAVIFTKSSCCMCYSIQQLFYELGASPAIHELDKEGNIGREMENALKRNGCTSLPAVFIGGRYVGSAKDVISLHVDGSLKQMLIDAKAIWF